MASIKKSTEKLEYISKEEFEKRIEIIKRSKDDIIWWAENFFRIVNMSTGLEVIKLYPKQKELLNFLIKNDRIVTLASRQTGKTTSYTIFCLWYATFFPDKKIMICANKLQTAIEIMGRIQKAYEYLPKFLKASVTVYNKSEIAFANGSVIKGFATGSSSARGFSGNCVTGETKVYIRFKFIPFIKIPISINFLRILGKYLYHGK